MGLRDAFKTGLNCRTYTLPYLGSVVRKARLRFIHEQERTQMKSLTTRRHFKAQTKKRKKN